MATLDLTKFSSLSTKIKSLLNTEQVQTFSSGLQTTVPEESGIDSIMSEIIDIETDIGNVLLGSGTKQDYDRAKELLAITSSWKSLISNSNLLIKHSNFCNPNKITISHAVSITEANNTTVITNTLAGDGALLDYTAIVNKGDVVSIEGSSTINGNYPVNNVTPTVLTLNSKSYLATSPTTCSIAISSNIKDVVLYAMRQPSPIDLNTQTRYCYNIDYANFKIGLYESEFPSNSVLSNWKSQLKELKTIGAEIPTIALLNHADYSAMLASVTTALNTAYPTTRNGTPAVLTIVNAALALISLIKPKFPNNALLNQWESTLHTKLGIIMSLYVSLA